MAAKFEEIDRNRGVDSLKPGPGWIMVPEGKSNIVCLTGGAGYVVKAVEGKNYVKIDVINHDKYCDEIGFINSLFIGKDDKLLRITGLDRGPGKIVATKGSDKAELEFSVHGIRTFNISFFFLHDLDGKNVPTSRTRFAQKDATGLVERLNQAIESERERNVVGASFVDPPGVPMNKLRVGHQDCKRKHGDDCTDEDAKELGKKLLTGVRTKQVTALQVGEQVGR